MSKPIEIKIISSTNCSLDATAKIPSTGALLIAEAKGKDSSNGNWTAILVNLTNIDTGAFQSVAERSDSERVILPIVVKEAGRYRIQAVQSNFRETCEHTTVSGRELDRGFFT